MIGIKFCFWPLCMYFWFFCS